MDINNGSEILFIPVVVTTRHPPSIRMVVFGSDTSWSFFDSTHSPLSSVPFSRVNVENEGTFDSSHLSWSVKVFKFTLNILFIFTTN